MYAQDSHRIRKTQKPLPAGPSEELCPCPSWVALDYGHRAEDSLSGTYITHSFIPSINQPIFTEHLLCVRAVLSPGDTEMMQKGGFPKLSGERAGPGCGLRAFQEEPWLEHPRQAGGSRPSH